MSEYEQPQIFKRTAKDSVFTHMFSEPKYLLELYKNNGKAPVKAYAIKEAKDFGWCIPVCFEYYF